MAPARKIDKRKKRGPKRVIRLKKLRKRIDAEPQVNRERGRPPKVDYTVELSEAICERLANGESGTSVCKDDGMPTWSMLQQWRRKYPDFERRYRLAREACCEYYADSIVDIADDGRNDYIERMTPQGRTVRVFDRESFERSRLRLDARKWTVSKILRHVYGDKSEVDVRTPDGVNVKVEERNALIEAICKLVHPKADGQTRPDHEPEEPRRER